jgi:hypothetical protein
MSEIGDPSFLDLDFDEVLTRLDHDLEDVMTTCPTSKTVTPRIAPQDEIEDAE